MKIINKTVNIHYRVMEDRGYGVEYKVFCGTKKACKALAFQKNTMAMNQYHGDDTDSDMLNGDGKPFSYYTEKI